MKRILFSIALVLTLCAGLSSNARADFLRYYVSGGPTEPEKTDPGAVGVVPLAKLTVPKSIWFGPSVGFDVFQLDLKTKQYQIGFVPGIGYGLKYCPAGWTLTPAVIALDVFVQATLIDDTNQVPGAKFFAIEALPIVTLLDWFSIGFGIDEFISVDTAPSALHFVFSFGVKKST